MVNSDRAAFGECTRQLSDQTSKWHIEGCVHSAGLWTGIVLEHFHGDGGRESNPDVRVQLHDLSTQEMLHGVREGKLQVALLVQVSPKALVGLVFEELQRLAVCVALHPAHPLARARRIGLEQVARERLVAFTIADYPEHQAWIASLFAPLNRSPKIVEEHDSITSLIAAVESGRGVAVIAQPPNGLASPRLKIRLLQPAPPSLVLGMAYRKESRSTAADSFIDAAKRAQEG